MTVRGAYGVRLSGLGAGTWLGVNEALHWPELSCKEDSRPEAPELFLDVHALELRVRADIAHSELVHPLLGRVASQVALAHGADAMHAGAVGGSAGAWAVIGPKGAGKSTLLASLNDAGVPIVTDDVLVFRDGAVMAGPRCIDLRPDAKGFGLGVAVRPSDPRNRIALSPIAADHPLVGLIHLEWSPVETTVEPLDHREAIKRPPDPSTRQGLSPRSARASRSSGAADACPETPPLDEQAGCLCRAHAASAVDVR